MSNLASSGLESVLRNVVDGVSAGVHVASDEVVEHSSEEEGSSGGHLHFLCNGESVLLNFHF